jgi:hypothetical protein
LEAVFMIQKELNMSITSDSPGRRVGLLLIPLVLAACAGNPPISAISDADTAVNQAMSAKASEYAPADLQRALDKVARAKQAMADENYDRARRLAEEARVDAQAAEAKARSASARHTLEEAQQTIDTLRQQTQRSGVRGVERPQGGSEDVNP